MSVLLIAVIAVIVIFAIVGYMRGLLGVLFNVFSWIFIALFVVVVNPYIYDFIVQQTSWGNTISSTTRSYVDGVAEKTVGSAIGNVNTTDSSSITGKDVESFLSDYNITLPDSLAGDVASTINSGKDSASNTVDSAKNEVKQATNNIVDGISNTIASYILRGIACLIAFAFAKLISVIVYLIIKHLQEAPVIHGVCSWLGMTLGIIKGLFVTWIFMFIVSITPTTAFGQFFLPMIEKSQILTFLYENNLVISIFYYFF